jgi:WD40-like Beta Propeller Repeat
MMSRLVASLAALAAVATVVGSAGCAQGSPVASTSADASVSVPAAPSVARAGVGAKAFGGHGRLAYASAGGLYVLDGSAQGRPATLHAVPTGQAPGSAGSPAWSPDGRWLAFLVGTPSAGGAVTGGALWLAGADGQGAREVLPKVAGFAWSPTTDELAATSGLGGKVFAVRPGKPTYPMLEVPGLFDGAPAWSPNGRELAVATVTMNAKKRFAGSAIYLFVPSEGIMVNNFASSRTNALIIDGWWATGEGLLAWSDPNDSASAAANGLSLVSYPLAGGSATLGRTLAYPSFAVPDDGGVTLVTGGGRYVWNAKTITGCSVAGKCGPAMDATPAPVNLDPAAPASSWGEPVLAFVHGASETTAGGSQRDLNAWYRTLRLWVWAGTGGNPRPITRAGTGVAAPTWSANSQDVLYVRDNALWLIAAFTAKGYPSTAPAARVVSRLFAGSWPNSNGYTAWQTQFAWHS